MYGGYIAEDGQLRTLDGREAIDKPLAEIEAEAGLNRPVFYAANVTVSEPRSTYLMNIGYTTNIEGTTNGWGGKRINGKVAHAVFQLYIASYTIIYHFSRQNSR